MKKLILFVLFISAYQFTYSQAGPCNATLIGTNTTVVSSTMLMDSAASTNAEQIILICAGNTLTYNWVLGKEFYVQNGATLVLKSAQIAKIYLESGATLVFDTVGAVFQGTIINGITYDSTNVTFVDTNQIHIGNASWDWMHCFNNTFNYTAFTPVQPCGPSAVDNSLQSVLDVTFTNPVYDRLHLHSLVSSQVSSAKIINLSGKVIKGVSNFNESLDVSTLPSGIYLIQFTAKGGETLTKKFLKN